jgi:hypothetical protein
MVVHLKTIDEIPFFVVPKIAICLACGFAQLAVPEAELRRLATKADFAATD